MTRETKVSSFKVKVAKAEVADRARRLRKHRTGSLIPFRCHPRALVFALNTMKATKRAHAFLRIARMKERYMDWLSARSLYSSVAAWLPHSYETVMRLALLDIMLADTPEKLLQVERCLNRIMVKFQVQCESDPDKVAATTLALLLYQRGADDSGNQIVRKLRCTHRLAPCILRYAPANVSCPPAECEDARRYVQVIDDAMPAHLLSHMREAFSQTSPFWQEHNYCPSPPSPYFSYLHSITDRPSNALEHILAYIRNITCMHFPQVREAKYVEWWAHCRPHCSGHQMHFDSDDEGRGGVRVQHCLSTGSQVFQG